ncbi:hypothetical protein PIB30_062387 [Stylosanthes scabra]|uniref:Uncharacterized protein n=1 Tax=Stylosanthes scabra TaxID=79078 RepID=A0ABU6XM28_9FABA|nr:hypothetical protein [Stylosanthes scabra]
MSEVEEESKVQAVELQSCRFTLEQEKKKKDLAEETGEIVQETFEILMDQVRHLTPAVDFSVITLDTR